jgi:sister chromatid cohesion protein PDS5
MFLFVPLLFLSFLQIYGIKTLVKSYLPFKDAHVRPDIDSLLDILRNMLSYGEMSKGLQSRYVTNGSYNLPSEHSTSKMKKQITIKENRVLLWIVMKIV